MWRFPTYGSGMRWRDAGLPCAAIRQTRRPDSDLELIAADLREALRAVGEVTGETTPDKVLDLIFQRFCIGK